MAISNSSINNGNVSLSSNYPQHLIDRLNSMTFNYNDFDPDFVQSSVQCEYIEPLHMSQGINSQISILNLNI